MTHYQKLATMIFRIIGVLIQIACLVFLLSALLVTFNPFFVLLATTPYLVVGIVLFAASRNLARWVCFDFDKFNEQ